MKKFDVTITEMLKKTVEVEAESLKEAGQKVNDEWRRGEHILYAENFTEVNFDAEEKQPEKLKVVILEPGKIAKEAEIDDTLEAMQLVVGGRIEQLMPFEDEVAIVCNEEGKLIGLPLNRAIYTEQEVDMSYSELKDKFRTAERNGQHMQGYVVFTEDSFDKKYPLEARTYVVSSDNKAYRPNMGGYSIYGSSLDGTDSHVRLEAYMSDEKGGKDGWKIERCYTKEREMIEIIAGTCFLCYAPSSSEKYLSMTPKLMNKYKEMFKLPEKFYRMGDEIKAVPYQPKHKNQER